MLFKSAITSFVLAASLFSGFVTPALLHDNSREERLQRHEDIDAIWRVEHEHRMFFFLEDFEPALHKVFCGRPNPLTDDVIIRLEMRERQYVATAQRKWGNSLGNLFVTRKPSCSAKGERMIFKASKDLNYDIENRMISIEAKPVWPQEDNGWVQPPN